MRCKCSHEKDEHRYNKFAWSHYECNNCACEEYVQSVGTSKGDKFTLIVGSILAGLYILVGVLVFHLSQLDYERGAWAIVTMVNDDVNQTAYFLIGIIILFVIVFIYSSLVSPYFRHKRRKNWNEQNHKS